MSILANIVADDDARRFGAAVVRSLIVWCVGRAVRGVWRWINHPPYARPSASDKRKERRQRRKDARRRRRRRR